MYRRVYRNTYRLEPGPEERIIDGRWWTEGEIDDPRVAAARAEGAFRISLETELARDLGVEIGDQIGWDVQGVTVPSVVTSLREVDWASLQPNFFAIFEPGALEDAPGMSIALVRSSNADSRVRVQDALLRDFPNVSFIDVTTVRETLERIAGQIALVLRAMAGFILGGGAIVLLASLLATRYRRRRESALLKTLGARGKMIRGALLAEYAALGGLGGLVGVVLGGVGGRLLLTRFFDLPGGVPWLTLGGLWMAVLLLAIAVGWSVSGPVLRSSPMMVLREEG
jgi:putative ABC transport system permease protein